MVDEKSDLLEYHERELSIAKEMRDRATEGRAYGKLAAVYHNLGDFKQAIGYNEQRLNIAGKWGTGQNREVPLAI